MKPAQKVRKKEVSHTRLSVLVMLGLKRIQKNTRLS